MSRNCCSSFPLPKSRRISCSEKQLRGLVHMGHAGIDLWRSSLVTKCRISSKQKLCLCGHKTVYICDALNRSRQTGHCAQEGCKSLTASSDSAIIGSMRFSSLNGRCAISSLKCRFAIIQLTTQFQFCVI